MVNGLISAYNRQENESRLLATTEASDWLQDQLKELKTRVDQYQKQLENFQAAHGLLNTPAALPNGEQGGSEHNTTLQEIEDLGHQLVTATTERILREAEYHAAASGDPERVIEANPQAQSGSGGLAAGMLQQLRAHRMDLEQEQAQSGAEHGPNYARVVEIRHQIADLDLQIKDEDSKLLERFHSAWQTAQDREDLLKQNLDERTAEAMKLNQAATEFAVMRQEANASHEVYLRVAEKIEEAGLAAGVASSAITVIDPALEPAKPVAPDLPLSWPLHSSSASGWR